MSRKEARRQRQQQQTEQRDRQQQQQQEEHRLTERIVFCKEYHRPTPTSRDGRLRTKADQKSRCPEWADDPRLRQALIDEALPDPNDDKDMYGRPRKLWTALAGKYFIGRSCEMAEPRYNCHPEVFPPGKLFAVMRERADRKLEDFLREMEE